MTTSRSAGVVHSLPLDMEKALFASKAMSTLWQGLTPLARNEWICWVISVKQESTRKEHVQRMLEDLKKGKRRPCCWMGCIHRTDKKLSPSVRGILAKRTKK